MKFKWIADTELNLLDQDKLMVLANRSKRRVRNWTEIIRGLTRVIGVHESEGVTNDATERLKTFNMVT
jgi:hypothetical protein